MSISDDIEYSALCEVCHSENFVETTISNCTKFEKSNFPKTIDDMTYVDIENQVDLNDAFEKYMYSATYDGETSYGDYEIAMHVHKDNMSPLEIQDMFDELAIKDLNKIMQNIRDVGPKLTLETTYYCDTCERATKHLNTEIPNIFDELL